MRAQNKFGITIAAIIRMMATTISNSISENPRVSHSSAGSLPSSVSLTHSYNFENPTVRLQRPRSNLLPAEPPYISLC